MALNLLTLLGLPAATDFAQQELDPLLNNQAPTSDEIVVSQRRPTQAAPEVEQTPLYEAPRVDRIDPGDSLQKEVNQRKGLFGMKGTLRDIVGLLGDAFLVQSGNKPLYQQQREREKMGDAMYGMTDPNNPQAFNAAIERLNARGFGEQAAEMYDRQQKYKSQDDARQSVIADRQYKQLTDARNRAARYLATADTPEKQAYALRLIKGMADQIGVTPEDLLGTSPDNLTDEQRRILGVGDMTLNQQNMMGYRQEQLAQRERLENMKERGRQSRYTPPQPKQQRSETEVEMFNRLNKKPANQRTPEEAAWIKKYTTGGKGSTKRERPALPGTTKQPAKASSGWGNLRVQ